MEHLVEPEAHKFQRRKNLGAFLSQKAAQN
jgi:hypothetical protein